MSKYIWIRTCYCDRDDNSTDAAHKALLEGLWIKEIMHDRSEGTVALGDVTLYGYGPDGWQRIFNRIPELIHDPPTPNLANCGRPRPGRKLS